MNVVQMRSAGEPEERQERDAVRLGRQERSRRTGQDVHDVHQSVDAQPDVQTTWPFSGLPRRTSLIKITYLSGCDRLTAVRTVCTEFCKTRVISVARADIKRHKSSASRC